MTTSPSIQPSFAAGEISTALYARVDLNAYWIALRTALNVIIMPQGGAQSRPGTEFVGYCKEHTYAPRLIRWKHGSGTTFWLEMGDSYIRFIKNGGHVTETGVNIQGITQADPAVVTTTAAHGYASTDQVFISGVGGMTEVNNRYFNITVTGTATFSLQHPVTDADVSSTGYGTASATSGTSARIYSITSPWDENEVWELDFAATSGVLTLCHPDYTTRELTRASDTSWTLAEIDYEPELSSPAGVAVAANSTGSETYEYRVTAIAADTLEESYPGSDATVTATNVSAITKADPAVVTANGHPFADGDEIYLTGVGGMTEVNKRFFTVANSATNTFELEGEDSQNYGTFTGTATAELTWTKITNGAATPDNTVSFTKVTDAIKYAIYRRDNAGGVFGLIGETKNTSFTDDNVAPDFSINPPVQLLPFRGSSNQPGAVGYYQQRRVFGGTTNDPDTSRFSHPGSHSNFSTSEAGAANDAFAITLDAQEVAKIRHYVPRRKLLVFTEGAEYTIHAIGSTDGFYFDTALQDNETNLGIGDVKPLVVDKKTLMIEKLGKRVYDVSYDIAEDGYDAVDLLALANHLTEADTLTDWTYAQIPYSLVPVIRSDGVMPVMTFKPEHRVTAWSRWTTDGEFKAVEAGPDDLGVDTIYCVVKRSLGGNVTYTIERFRNREIDGDVQEYFGVDCGEQLNSPIAISTISSTNPVVVTTTAAHGLSNGDEIDFDDIIWEPTVDSDYNETQPSQLNKLGPFKVANKTSNTFQVTDTDDVDVDGSSYNAYARDGNVYLRVSSVGNLWHLEGETDIAVVYNGTVLLDQTITSGKWTVPNSGKASRIYVGKRYNCDLETLNIESRRGTIQGGRKLMPYLKTRVEDTAGILVGPDSANLVSLIKGESSFTTQGTEATLSSGDIHTDLLSKWESNGRLLYRQPYPLPMKILAVIPDVAIGGRQAG